jgi:hypothetical protein
VEFGFGLLQFGFQYAPLRFAGPGRQLRFQSLDPLTEPLTTIDYARHTCSVGLPPARSRESGGHFSRMP